MKAYKLLTCKILGGIYILFSTACQSLPSADSVFPSHTINSTAANREKEYQDLLKVYKNDRIEVLNDLLGGDDSTKQTSIVVNNDSSCNMVLTITSKDWSKKIPIEAGKAGYSMVDRNKSYTLTGYACNAPFTHNKYVTESYIITIK